MIHGLWRSRAVRAGAGGATLHGRMLQVAQAAPRAAAVIFQDETLTYGELADRAEGLATELQTRGVGPGSLVAVHVQRGFAMVEAVLGVLIAGAAYLPLDVAAPPLQLDRVMREAEPDLLIADDGATGTAWRGAAPELRVGDRASAKRTRDAGPPTAGGDDLAYVIYTSGSTGRPKGVEVTHGAVLNLLDGARRAPGFGARDVLLALANLAFDVSVVDLFLPLTTGGRLVLASRDEALDFSRLAALIEASRCTLIQATPTTWQGLVSAGWAGSRRLKICSGADVLGPALARELLARGREVWNMYGPTEATVWCAQHRVRPDEDPIPIGAPVHGMQIQVAGPDGREAGVGEAGELLISGAGLARGYRRAPDLTGAKFLRSPEPFGERVYRSGDLGRQREDGRLEWIGRLDRQVKVRGYRIELGDVEAALASHPEVATAAVRASSDENGVTSLFAYVLPRDPNRAPTESELRRWLRERRPIYLVPRHITLVDVLPRTAGGKVDWMQLEGSRARG